VNKLGDLQEFGRIHREALISSEPWPDYCRVCGPVSDGTGLDRHHVVYRSLGGTNKRENLVNLCRSCHDAVHAKRVDLLPYLNLDEQGYAASLIGIERAHRLLAPSVYKSERLR
jgi:hypothetical protein